MDRTTHRRAYAVWAVGLLAYVTAVLQRTSLGVAGLQATDRFDASASILATFAVLQLLVYAGLQIPVGVVLDRVGPRRLIVVGAAIMAGGQLLMALTHDVPGALVARVLVGSGDAMTFVSVLRLVSVWFPPRRVPVFTQLTGLIGQGGQLLSAIPLVALLGGPGWTPAFLSAASLSVVAAVVAVVGLQGREHPDPAPVQGRPSPSRAELRGDIAAVWRNPGARLGFWSHFTSQFSGTVFVLLWGFPFLTSGEGLPRGQVSALFTLFVLTGAMAGPVLGALTAAHPLRRSWLVITIVGTTALVWTAVLVQSGPAPRWLLVLLVLVLAVGGPGSMIGFDFGRSFTPPHRLGSAMGVINVGGFLASLVTILAIGLILDARTPDGIAGYSLGSFRVAFCVQYAVWAVGLIGLLRSRRLARRDPAADGVVVPPIRTVLADRYGIRLGPPGPDRRG